MKELISKEDAMAACKKVFDDAKGYSIPQMAMGANACRDAIDALLIVTQPNVDALIDVLKDEIEWHKSKGIQLLKAGSSREIAYRRLMHVERISALERALGTTPSSDTGQD